MNENIEIKQMIYVSNLDRTQILYNLVDFRGKRTEHLLEFQGRFKGKPTEFNVISFIEQNLKFGKEKNGKS
jgi:hypothetical protein